MESRTAAEHLTDGELFALAVPATGEPEALPPHLLACGECGRALQEWKLAVRQLSAEEVEPVLKRSPEEWRAREESTLEALRLARARRRFRPAPWAAGLAASLLAGVLLLVVRRAPERDAWKTDRPATSTAAAELSAQDAADDRLLRDVARLARGEERGDWNRLAPDPTEPDPDPL